MNVWPCDFSLFFQGHIARDLTTTGLAMCVLSYENRIKCWGGNSLGDLGLGDVKHRGDNPGEMGDFLPYVDLGTVSCENALSFAENLV